MKYYTLVCKVDDSLKAPNQLHQQMLLENIDIDVDAMPKKHSNHTTRDLEMYNLEHIV